MQLEQEQVGGIGGHIRASDDASGDVVRQIIEAELHEAGCGDHAPAGFRHDLEVGLPDVEGSRAIPLFEMVAREALAPFHGLGLFEDQVLIGCDERRFTTGLATQLEELPSHVVGESLPVRRLTEQPEGFVDLAHLAEQVDPHQAYVIVESLGFGELGDQAVEGVVATVCFDQHRESVPAVALHLRRTHRGPRVVLRLTPLLGFDGPLGQSDFLYEARRTDAADLEQGQCFLVPALQREDDRRLVLQFTIPVLGGGGEW